MKLSVIIPIHNEVDTIHTLVSRVLALPLDTELLLVDDASTDGSRQIIADLSSPQVKAIHHQANWGKGAAVRTGLAAASGDLIVIQDADLEYDPQDFLKLIAAIDQGQVRVVYGVRSLTSQKRMMRWGNRFVTWLANMLYGQRLQDMETCYKMMERSLALSLQLESRGFDLEAEITAKLLRSGQAIHQVPIRYQARYDNKKLSPLDGLPTVRALWRYRRWAPTPS